MNNCTLLGNSAALDGGGARGCTLNNCTLTGNAATIGAGANWSMLNNCTVTGNKAVEGGGANGCTLNNCTLTGNSALSSGGVSSFWVASRLNNCIVYFNTDTNGVSNYDSELSVLNYCCTTPLPTNGVGNITNAPLFVDYAGGNLRLQSNSPCINAGNNGYLTSCDERIKVWFTNLFDLDGSPRLVSGTVDMGAYEFQGTGSVISYAWLQNYGLPTDGSADVADADRDGLNNWQEWRCGTDPTHALSALRLLKPVCNGTKVTVRWESVSGVNYFLERSIDLGASPLFMPLATSLPGQTGTTSFTDTNAAAPRLFYRVGVRD